MTMIINMFRNLERIPLSLSSKLDIIMTKTEKLLTIENDLISKLQLINLNSKVLTVFDE